MVLPPALKCFEALVVRLALFPFVFTCFWALGIRLGLFPPVVSCAGALGVLLDLFPPAFTYFATGTSSDSKDALSKLSHRQCATSGRPSHCVIAPLP